MRPTLVACLFLLVPVSGRAQPITPPPVAAPPLPAGNDQPKPAPATAKTVTGPACHAPGGHECPATAEGTATGPTAGPAAIPSEITVSPPPVSPPPLDAVSTGPPVVVADNTEIPQGIEERRRLVLPSQKGPVGLYRLTAADAGDVGQVRLALHGEYGSSDDFLVRGSRNRRLAGTLSVGFTPHRFVELFGAILASANQNQRCATGEGGCSVENDRADPPTIRAFGDLVFGGKLAAPVLPWLGLGAEAGVRLFAANDGLSLEGDATSAWLNALGSVNLRELSKLPLHVHINLGYYLDNSRNLQDFSQFRASMLPSRLVTTFAYGMGSSRVRSGLGVAAPLLGDGIGVALEPYAEYHVELVTGEPEPAYSAFMPPECDMPMRKCIDNRDQQWLSFGLRAQLRRGFAVSAGVDITLRSVGFPYGPALLPWNLIVGVAQSFDFSGPPKTVTRTVTLQRTVERPPPPKEGFVHGKVMNAEVIGEPIAGAVVSVIGQNRGRVATDIDGSFATKGLPPGPVKLEISAPSFEPQVIEARIAIGKTTEVGASLRPTLPPPRIEGRVSDANNRPLTAGANPHRGPHLRRSGQRQRRPLHRGTGARRLYRHHRCARASPAGAPVRSEAGAGLSARGEPEP